MTAMLPEQLRHILAALGHCPVQGGHAIVGQGIHIGTVG